jgi:hypothetical protein
VEWPELLRHYTAALREYALWMDGGCTAEPPTLVDGSQVRGPLPLELRSYATDVLAEVASMQEALTCRLATLRSAACHSSSVRAHYDERPMPLYLDALG